MSKVLSARVADDLARRVEEIAAARSVKPSAVVKAAVEGYVDGCSRGLSDGSGSVGGVVAAAAGVGRVRLGRVDTVSDAQRWAMERQRKLNDAKGGAK